MYFPRYSCFHRFQWRQANQIDRVVVFGSSLNDTGNAFVLLSDPDAFGFGDCDLLGTPSNVPPYDKLDDLLIPDGGYAKGGHHVSNGATWIEQFARGRGLSGNTRPALRNSGKNASNYAVGGARASDYPCRFNLSAQLAAYNDDSLEITEKTLFVFEFGGNDIRDPLVAGDPSIIGDALFNISVTVHTLYFQGARKFLLVNVPALGEPIVDAANFLTLVFNNNLALLQNSLLNELDDVDIRTLDLHALLNEIIADPESFGISNIEDACVTPEIAPFKCKKPDTYLFWDGLHPAKASTWYYGAKSSRSA